MTKRDKDQLSPGDYVESPEGRPYFVVKRLGEFVICRAYQAIEDPTAWKLLARGQA
jgi:hypothetical protein